MASHVGLERKGIINVPINERDSSSLKSKGGKEGLPQVSTDLANIPPVTGVRIFYASDEEEYRKFDFWMRSLGDIQNLHSVLTKMLAYPLQSGYEAPYLLNRWLADGVVDLILNILVTSSRILWI